jgi:hypothetical protein
MKKALSRVRQGLLLCRASRNRPEPGERNQSLGFIFRRGVRLVSPRPPGGRAAPRS